MKVTLDMIKICQIRYSWNTIYIALVYNLMEINEIGNYAMDLMSMDNYVDKEFVNDLAWGTLTKEEAVSSIETEMLNLKSILNVVYELDIIRYTMLMYLKKNYEKSSRLMLEKIAEVYADFNYPVDMAKFIYYMPTDEKPIHENGVTNMMMRFDIFINELEKKLTDIG